MPILGILTSQITGNASQTAFQSIASTTVGSGGTQSVSFTLIPSTYKHLQVRIMGSTSINDSPALYFNGDTTDMNYWTHTLIGNGSNAYSWSVNSNYIPYYAGTGTSKSATIIDILDYTDTNKKKTSRVLGGYDANGSGAVFLQSLLWSNTARISTIRLRASSGTVWDQYTNFALYGIK